MKEALEQLKEFHRVFRCAFGECVAEPNTDTRELRKRLMVEELNETLDAMDSGDLVEVADGLADLCYVAIGTAVAYGIPLDKVFDAVHKSNMAKAPGGVVTYREDGKVIKPAGWTPPTMEIFNILKAAE